MQPINTGRYGAPYKHNGEDGYAAFHGAGRFFASSLRAGEGRSDAPRGSADRPPSTTRSRHRLHPLYAGRPEGARVQVVICFKRADTALHSDLPGDSHVVLTGYIPYVGRTDAGKSLDKMPTTSSWENGLTMQGTS